MDPKKTCLTCAYFAALAKECHINPPLAVVLPKPSGEIGIMGYFPGTKAENFCGKWKKEGGRS
jgi:hypothetical protein